MLKLFARNNIICSNCQKRKSLFKFQLKWDNKRHKDAKSDKYICMFIKVTAKFSFSPTKLFRLKALSRL